MNPDDFSKLGFNKYQSTDLFIIMNLKTAEEMQEWMNAVGPEDVAYGMDLLSKAAEAAKLDEIDNMVSRSDLVEAKFELARIMAK